MNAPLRWCLALLATASLCAASEAAGRDGLALLAKKHPDTVYGRKAAASGQ